MKRNPELKSFYHSQRWRKISRLYMAAQNYVCERCGGVGEICHHRKHLTPENVSDFAVSLDFSNLECLCMTCHNREHFSTGAEREVIFDAEGNAVAEAYTPPSEA